MGILPYEQTDMTENITFPQLRWRIVIHDKHKKIHFRFCFHLVWMDLKVNGVLMVGRTLMEFCRPVPVFVHIPQSPGIDLYYPSPDPFYSSDLFNKILGSLPQHSRNFVHWLSILLSPPAIRLYVQISKHNDSRCPLIAEPSASILYVSHPVPSITAMPPPSPVPGFPSPNHHM